MGIWLEFFLFFTGNETLGGLAVEAAKGALLMAEVEADAVDLVILCTSTPDDLFGGGSQVWWWFYSKIIQK